MNQDLIDKTRDFVSNTFEKRGKSSHVKHLFRTEFWIRKLNPKSDIALRIAAMSHDIGPRDDIKDRDFISYNSPDFIGPHQKRGAKIMSSFLKKENAPGEIIKKVKHLILKHEEGGDEDQNILKDADSISFFENNVDGFIKYHIPIVGIKKVKDKFDWMYERITTQKAKNIVKKWYQEAINKIDKTD